MLILALISLVTSFFGSLAAFVFVLHYDLNGLLEQKLHERVVRKQRKHDPGAQAVHRSRGKGTSYLPTNVEAPDK